MKYKILIGTFFLLLVGCASVDVGDIKIGTCVEFDNDKVTSKPSWFTTNRAEVIDIFPRYSGKPFYMLDEIDSSEPRGGYPLIELKDIKKIIECK